MATGSGFSTSAGTPGVAGSAGSTGAAPAGAAPAGAAPAGAAPAGVTAAAGASAAPPGADGSRRSIGDLVAQAQQDATLLIRQEIELAKAELRDDAKKAGLGAGLFVFTAILMALASILLSVAAALGLAATGLHPAVAFLIVGVAYVILGGLLGLIGAHRLQKIRGPERAISEAKESRALLDHLKA